MFVDLCEPFIQRLIVLSYIRKMSILHLSANALPGREARKLLLCKNTVVFSGVYLCVQ